MALREPAICTVNVTEGQLINATGRYVKRLRDLEGLFADPAAFAEAMRRDGDTIVYEVTDYRPTDASGDMIFGVTRMAPGGIGDEFYFTRGHIHRNANRPEMYYGEAGSGLMLLESPDGETRVLPIGPRTVCYVPPFWIHRSVNVGAKPLVMTFAYPADSGQDYGVIARTGGMRQRIMRDGNGGWKAIDNTAYHKRPADEVEAIFATAS
jgi:glucose-6-phosphate isomerase